MTNLPYLSDPYRIEYISFSRRGPISVLETFQRYETLEAEGGLDGMAYQYDDYRHAFAYPEWYGRKLDGFDGDTLNVPYPPELELERVDKPDPDTGELKNYIKTVGLEAYLWLGVSWEDYEPSGEPFQGWKEELRAYAVDFCDLGKASPDTSTKAEWLADQCDWGDVVDAYRANLAEQANLRIKFERE